MNGEPILCNLCGLSGSDLGEGTPNFGIFHGVELEARGGYASTPGNGDGALDDCTSYHFRLCEFCLDFLFSNAVIPPKVWDDGQEEFRPAKERVAQDDWRNHRVQEWKDRFNSRQSARQVLTRRLK